MSDSIKLTSTIAAEPKLLYNAWLDRSEHEKFSNKNVTIEKKVDSDVSLFDGYVSGTLELIHMNKRIIVKCKTTDFPEDAISSTLEVSFEKVKNGTKVIMQHSDIPDETGKQYRKFWRDNYLKPMKEYFESKKKD